MASAAPQSKTNLEPILEPILSRSGVEPPTGTIHPRESRGTEDRKQESKKVHFGEMSFRIWNCERIFDGGGAFRSGVQPPTGTDWLRKFDLISGHSRPARFSRANLSYFACNSATPLRNSSKPPLFSKTSSARDNLAARGNCAETIRRIPSASEPSRRIARATCKSTAQSTTAIRSHKSAIVPDSKSNGALNTAYAPPDSAPLRKRRSDSARIKGCSADSNRLRKSASAKTRSRTNSRFNSPAAFTAQAPSAARAAATPSPPARVKSRPTTSASTTQTPSVENIRAASLFPDPIPPVKPAQNISPNPKENPNTRTATRPRKKASARRKAKGRGRTESIAAAAAAKQIRRPRMRFRKATP